jgi:GNAT superfamily N-acetyltransferase
VARGLLPARHRLARRRPRARGTLITAGPDHPIRAARPAEAAALSGLCLRAKAHWGYAPDFLEQCREALTVTPATIAARQVFVATDAGDRPVGLHQIGEPDASGTVELVLLYVEPAAMGGGIGRRLFAHASALAQARGGRRLSILADPHAAPFYRAQGAGYLADVPSDAIPGRMLPVYVLPLDPAGRKA